MSNKRILLVDDDPDIIYYFGKYLRKNGYPDLLTAEKATPALELIEKEKPDLIILDVQLNDAIDGIEILRRTKSTLSPKSLVVMISGHKDLYDKECEKIGSHSFLGKPIGPEEVLAHIQTIFLG